MATATGTTTRTRRERTRRQVDFDVTDAEMLLIIRIAGRAVTLAEKTGARPNQTAIEMDIAAAHRNGCPLRLAELLEASDADCLHDVSGIVRYLDRRTGALTDNFEPRFAATQGGR